jgi:hypothetical protein
MYDNRASSTQQWPGGGSEGTGEFLGGGEYEGEDELQILVLETV